MDGDRDTVLDLCGACHAYPCHCNDAESDGCCLRCGKYFEGDGGLFCDDCEVHPDCGVI